MGHFARVNVTGKVDRVIVAEQPFIDTLPDSGMWVQTSYNTRGGVHYDPATGEPSADQSKALRFNYAGIGYTYDAQRDSFIPPKPYPSWTLDEATCLWQAPVPMPTTGGPWQWDEAEGDWVEAEAP
jgi:hypothetical protein